MTDSSASPPQLALLPNGYGIGPADLVEKVLKGDSFESNVDPSCRLVIVSSQALAVKRLTPDERAALGALLDGLQGGDRVTVVRWLPEAEGRALLAAEAQRAAEGPKAPAATMRGEGTVTPTSEGGAP